MLAVKSRHRDELVKNTTRARSIRRSGPFADSFHQLPTRVLHRTLLDWPLATSRLAQETPLWFPGTAVGYPRAVQP